MNEKFIELYENIKNGFYKHKLERFNSTVLFAYRATLVESFMQELMDKYCNTNEAIKTVKTLDENKIRYYRGITIPSQSYLKNLSEKIYTFHRFGLFGYGQYFSSEKVMALAYADDKEDNILEANFDDDFKKASYQTIVNISKDFAKQLNRRADKLDPKVLEFISYLRLNENFVTIFAGAMGFDAITKDDSSDEIVCVINPKKVTYLEKEM